MPIQGLCICLENWIRLVTKAKSKDCDETQEVVFKIPSGILVL